MGVEVLPSKEVMEETKRDWVLTSTQSALVATPPFQPSGIGGKDVRALADLALLDLAASFGPEFLGPL